MTGKMRAEDLPREKVT